MRQVVIVSGVLGGGSALVFALAAAVAAAFPTGTLVASGWNGGREVMWVGGGGVKAWPAPGPVVIDDVGSDIEVPPDVAPPMPVVVNR